MGTMQVATQIQAKKMKAEEHIRKVIKARLILEDKSAQIDLLPPEQRLSWVLDRVRADLQVCIDKGVDVYGNGIEQLQTRLSEMGAEEVLNAIKQEAQNLKHELINANKKTSKVLEDLTHLKVSNPNLQKAVRFDKCKPQEKELGDTLRTHAGGNRQWQVLGGIDYAQLLTTRVPARQLRG
jgi:hypothetical protein